MYIPDPIELMEARIEHYMDNFVNEYTCMQCGKKVDYELICLSPIGDGPAVCAECAGIDDLHTARFIVKKLNDEECDIAAQASGCYTIKEAVKRAEEA